MTGLRSTSDSKMASTPSKDETASKANTTPTTNRGFEEKLRGNGVIHPMDSSRHPPANENELLELLDNSRASASPTASQYDDYVNTYKSASWEADMVHMVSTRVLKEPSRQLRNKGYHGSRDKQWVDIPTTAVLPGPPRKVARATALAPQAPRPLESRTRMARSPLLTPSRCGR